MRAATKLTRATGGTIFGSGGPGRKLRWPQFLRLAGRRQQSTQAQRVHDSEGKQEHPHPSVHATILLGPHEVWLATPILPRIEGVIQGDSPHRGSGHDFFAHLDAAVPLHMLHCEYYIV